MASKLLRVILFLPLVYWMYLIFFGSLGADPAKSLNHKTGEMALYYIILNLLLGILISFRVPFLKHLRFLVINRRFLGVLSFFILLFHFGLYLVMESFEFKAFEQMYTKLYLIFASIALIILFVLAIISNDMAVKKLGGKRWKLLHRSVYVASLFFSMHIMLIEKADLIKYGIILGSLWLMQSLRVIRNLMTRTKKKYEPTLS
jgi:methionine sulfoxide reductase heme-binding subunit